MNIERINEQLNFVKLNGKIRVDKMFYTKEEVTDINFENDYGRLVLPGYIVFDFDKFKDSTIILNILKNEKIKCKILYTTRGIHVMLKTHFATISNINHQFNWIGLECDIKGVGLYEGEKICYQAIKVNGIVRKEEFLNGATCDNELDIAPKWLYHIPQKENPLDLTGDLKGERNSLFYGKLMIRAKKYYFSYEEYLEQANIINNYVLEEGISQKELEQATRKDAWDNIKIEEKLTLKQKAQEVIESLGCILIDNNLTLYDIKENKYERDLNKISSYLQNKYEKENITTVKMEEIMRQINIILKANPELYSFNRDKEFILCGDKLISIRAPIEKNPTREIYTDIHYPYTIMDREEFENFDGLAKHFMNQISCNNPKIKQAIWESIGCIFSPIKPFGKLFIWHGNGNNGKSLLINLIEDIGGDLISSADILKINDKFALDTIVGSVANITDDVGNTTLSETGLLKTLIQGSKIEVEAKYKRKFQWKPNTQFIICCNNIPKIDDTSKGILRRLAFIPFDLQLSEEEIDINLYTKLSSDPNTYRYILTGGIFAMRQALQKGLTKLPKQKELITDFEVINESSVSSFVRTNPHINNCPTEKVYNNYKLYCEENKITKIETKTKFSRELKKHNFVSTTSGRGNYRIYKKMTN